MNITQFFTLPAVASSHGHEVDFIIYIIHYLMLILLIGWGSFFIYVLFRFNKKRNPTADYLGVRSHASSTIEVLLVIIETILLAGFSIPFWNKQVNAFPQRSDTVEVRLIAVQFAWNFHYPGADGVFGKTDYQYFDKQSNPLGIDPNDPQGKDDFSTINQLHLPIGKPAIIYLSSKDVIHSFGVNSMRVKQDVIPGMIIPTWFTPTKTGQYEIACSQLCGIGHYSMRGFLTVHSQEDYDQWFSQQASSSGEEEGGGDDFWN
ncbi:MAG: cytochrome c oxidase subunit II [Candidatus Omnitrophota bacterium]|nr:cytochrome c oxidase subunit II [Candidatus Omnitrophota bacterium]